MVQEVYSDPKCEMCGKSLKGKVSFDMWILQTAYDIDGEVLKTQIESDIKDDYIVVGVDCCGASAKRLWDTVSGTVRVVNKLRNR